MAYNLAPFNRTAFNIGSGDTVWLDVTLQESVTPAIGSSLEVFTVAIANERINIQNIIAGNGIYIASSLSETVSEQVTSAESSLVLPPLSASEIITCAVNVVSEVMPPVSCEENVAIVEGIASANIYISAQGKEILSGEAVTDKEKYLIVSGYEFVNSSATLEAVDIYVCELNVTLKPGERIVIDAENYNVLLDNENYIWAQSGEWIDELSRETTSISVTAMDGVANLEASILYKERYL